MRRVTVAVLLLAATAGAQEDSSADRTKDLAELSLEELVKVRVTSIATGSEKPVPEVAAIATVITAQDIRAMGATTLEEALQAVPGLYVSASAQNGAKKYLIRGGYATQYNPEILVMINGVPITSAFRGDRNGRLGVIPVKMISRIEVIRGPGSALYGADALAGVINVVTKGSSEIQGTELGAGAGTFNTFASWLFHSDVQGDFKSVVMANFRGTEGQKRIITEDAQTALDRAFGTSASLAPGPMNLSEDALAVLLDMEKGKFRLRASYFGAWNLGSGQGVAEALDPGARYSRSRTLVDLNYHEPKLTPNWDALFQISYHHGAQVEDRTLVLFPPGANLGSGVFPNGVIGNPEFWERQIRFDNTAFYTGFHDHKIRLGLGYAFIHLYKIKETKNFTSTLAPRPGIIDVSDTPEAYLPEKIRNTFYGYAQDEWGLSENWNLTLGARYDYYSDFGGTFNPRAALVWKATSALTAKFLYGRAFRAPNFVELYSINNPVLIGNTNLKPETANTVELGATYQVRSSWRLGLNLFHYGVADVISLVRDPIGTATAQNSGHQTGNGLELETKHELTSDLLLTGNYSFVKATDQDSGKPVGTYPNHRLYLRDDWAFLPGWSWSNQLNWVGERDRQPTDTRAPLKGYATLDLIVRRSIRNRGEIAAVVRNLFDADVREPSSGPGPTAVAAAIPNDLPQAGRSFYVEAAWQF